MTEDRVERRLAAVVAADVAGYSRLVGEDEEGTIARLKQVRKELIAPKIAAHHGRIVKLMGDGVLVEYASVVDAVRSAVEIQRAMAERNRDVPERTRIEFRVGINVGDIVIDGGDIYGDGVNIAARLEAIAEPGGICVSRSVRDQVRDKLEIALEDMGEQTLKNIAKPVRAFRVMLERPRAGAAAGAAQPAEPAALDRAAIAVLAFQNMSGDPEQEYFADGVAEDVITALSRFRWFYVIARNSSFTYKGRAVDVRAVGRELGARYVLEGSVRKGGNRLRITAQLIEAATGNHLWAEKYDGALEEVFELQDRITMGVVAAIEPSVRQAEVERARRKRPDNLDAYDLYLRALPHAWAWTWDDAEKANVLLDAALGIDPNYAAAHGVAAWCNTVFSVLSPNDPRRTKSVFHARAVLARDTDDALALAFAAFALAFFERDYDIALHAVKRALALTPHSPIVLSMSALTSAFAGNFDTALEHAEVSLRLSPFDPMRFSSELAIGYSQFFLGRYDESAEAAQRCVNINPQFVPAFGILVASRARGGRKEAAQAAAERLLRLNPDFHVGEFIRLGRFAPELNDRYAAALREGGLPE